MRGSSKSSGAGGYGAVAFTSGGSCDVTGAVGAGSGSDIEASVEIVMPVRAVRNTHRSECCPSRKCFPIWYGVFGVAMAASAMAFKMFGTNCEDEPLLCTDLTIVTWTGVTMAAMTATHVVYSAFCENSDEPLPSETTPLLSGCESSDTEDAPAPAPALESV